MFIDFGSSGGFHNNYNKSDYNNATLIVYSTPPQFISMPYIPGGW